MRLTGMHVEGDLVSEDGVICETDDARGAEQRGRCSASCSSSGDSHILRKEHLDKLLLYAEGKESL